MAEVLPRDILLRIGCTPHGVVAVSGARRVVGSLAPAYTHTRADASTCATLIDRGGVVRKAAANKLRIEFVDLDGDGIRETPGILLEGSRQNLILRSEEIDNAAWSKTTVTLGANAEVAPDGATTGDRLIEGALSQEHVVFQTLTGAADVRHASTVFAKAGTRNWLVLSIRDVNAQNNAVRAWFNLTTGVVGTVNTVGAGSSAQAFIEKAASWYRCKLIGACNNGDTTPVVTYGVSNADGTQSYTGDGASYISLWGAQFEKDVAFPSSYIPTGAAAVTRAADLLTALFNFGLGDFTVIARVARPVHADVTGDIGIPPGIMDLGSAQPLYTRMYFVQATRTVQSDIQTGGTNSFGSRTIPAGNPVTMVSQFKDFATGGQTATDVGAGQSAFGSVATILPGFGSQTLRVGRVTTAAELFGVLLDLTVVRGLRSFNEMLAVAAA